MRMTTLTFLIGLFLLSGSNAYALDTPIRIVGASGSSESLEQANRDLFRYFSRGHQRRYGRMTVISSSTSFTTSRGRRISLIKAKLQMRRVNTPHWIAFSAWRHKGDVFRGVVYVFRKDLSHRHFLLKKVSPLLSRP